MRTDSMCKGNESSISLSGSKCGSKELLFNAQEIFPYYKNGFEMYPESLILCLYSEISNHKYDGRFTMTNFIVIYTKPNESVVLCQPKHLSHTYRILYERHSNGMPLLHRTTLPAVSLFAFVLVDKAAGIATDN